MWDGPLLFLMIAIGVYWAGVMVMVTLARRWGAASAGLIPSQTGERLMWVIWAPVIVCWVVFPWLVATQDDWPWALPGVGEDGGWQLIPAAVFQGGVYTAIRWLAAIGALACVGATIGCWAKMGRSWRIGVVPDDQATLVTGGAYRFVRHPIYALSVAMMACTAVVAPIWPMLVIAALHLIFMNIKARNEEQFLQSVHGEAYRQYMATTGRFLPHAGRWWSWRRRGGGGAA